ncbi:uncharacterized protein LOC122849384 [Aphidius gifuensis]|uniref:uncharacterized protein LOC122849384 n=1 Tax=Aphidius gifuensis TaxID=684658 RepID=UPI001CDC25A6|nr:uncharacterized protein LOC122849384 [Aphidius gifuensis]
MLRAKEEYEIKKTNDSQLQLDCYSIFFDKTLRTIEESIETIAKCTRENVDEYYNCRDEHIINQEKRGILLSSSHDINFDLTETKDNFDSIDFINFSVYIRDKQENCLMQSILDSDKKLNLIEIYV